MDNENVSNEIEYIQEELEGVVEHTVVIDSNGEHITYVAFADARHEIDINETHGPYLTKIALLGKKYNLEDASDYHSVLDVINEYTTTTVLDNHPEAKRSVSVVYASDVDPDMGDVHAQAVVLATDAMNMVTYSTALRLTKEAANSCNKVVQMIIKNNVDKSHGV